MADAGAISKEISSKLRGYDGLSAAKLAECPALLEALDTTDPQQAYERLVQVIDSRLPDDRFTAALKYALRLDPSLPDSLTGRSGRRMVFGMIHAVSEETVKSWEARAIETLSQTLVSRPNETLIFLGIIFWVINSHITYRTVVRLWQQGDDTSSMRMGEHTDYIPESRIGFPFAAYQMGPDEHAKTITINMMFTNTELPKFIMGYGRTDFFGFLSGNYDGEEVQGPRPGEQMVDDVGIHMDVSLEDFSYYWIKWHNPQPLEVYGVMWVPPDLADEVLTDDINADEITAESYRGTKKVD